MFEREGRKGQITLFVIIAILLIAGIVTVFLLRDKIFSGKVSGEFSPVYQYFDNCIEETTRDAINIAGSQGGYINTPDFIPGNEYAPFSSQLDFLGIPVPYWYYVSGNGIIREQVPSKSLIERQISDYLNSELERCDFSSLALNGYNINTRKPESSVKISDNRVDVDVLMDLSVSKADSNAVKRNHRVEVKSNFGKFYSLASKIYDKQKKEAFLENYSIDVLYNYAPVTGVELSCSPLVWNPQDVVKNIREGLAANIGNLKVKGDYYDLKNTNNKYFVIDLGEDVKENVRFLYDSRWPSRIEIWPVENQIMIAEPVGLEEGLGVLGFCYVPYHFVYDTYYPVLVQISDGEEIFQFPVAVVIDKTVSREALSGEVIDEQSSLDEFCSYKNTNIRVYTFDSNIAPVEADISFTCLNQKCNMGTTKISGSDAILSTNFPQCVNGKIIAKAEGYAPAEYYISTNNPGTANILLDKLYEKPLEVVVGGIPVESRDANALVVISFKGDKYSTTLVYPEQKKVKLTEGFYNVSVRVFSGTDLKIPGSSESKCVQIPSPGILGFFGKTKEECFTINLPEQTLSNYLSAGGNSQEFILESDLKSGNKIKISVPVFQPTTSLEQLQQNYELLDSQNIFISYQ
ncbi:MAG: hypothetical protein QXI33_00785 [Candidatus Pacearchaeota archaeon]